jgi:hypothetical protein
MKENNTDQYLGDTYDFSGGEGYFMPMQELSPEMELSWDSMQNFEACKVKLIDIYYIAGLRTLNFYLVELPTGEKD